MIEKGAAAPDFTLADKDGKPVSLSDFRGKRVVLYFYPKDVADKAKTVKPSSRGELEITSLNDIYLHEGFLNGVILGRGVAWLDTGTSDSLVEATTFVQMVEKRQGIKISAPEEIAYRNGWIDRNELLSSANRYGNSPYGQHLKNVANRKIIY